MKTTRKENSPSSNSQKQKITRGWPPKRRAQQAERIKKIKPWLKSTGPITTKGKNRSKMNAYKHGCRTLMMRRIASYLAWQRQFMKEMRMTLAYFE